MLLSRRLITPAPVHRVAVHLRTASTISCHSGRVYVREEVLQRHPTDENRSIFKAKCGKDSFVLKRVPRQFYELFLKLKADFAGSRGLRMHVDCNEEEAVLVYPFFRSTLLELIRDDQDLAVGARKHVLRCVGEAIQELHGKDWIHLDVKPDNILLNWTPDEEGNKIVNEVALGDFDIAYKSDGSRLDTLRAIGNVMWRSPEGQTGRGLTKASDIFSFGLVCIFAMGGGDFLLLNDYQALVKSGFTAEQEILVRHLCYFGPDVGALYKQVNNEVWCKALEAASAMAEAAVTENPELSFEHWSKELGPEPQSLISGMTNLDPAARSTIDQVLSHHWWQDDT